jgi:hypothetical protein
LQGVARNFLTLFDGRWIYRRGWQTAVTSDHVLNPHDREPEGLAGWVCSRFGVAMSLGMSKVLPEQALGKAQESLRFPVSRMRDFSF